MKLYFISILSSICFMMIGHGIHSASETETSRVAELQSFIRSRLSEDGKLSFMGLAAKYGHPAERRLVITEDGYHLTLYHMQGDANRVVLLVHGNTADSDSWIIRGDTSLAITLARQGYDVWAINMRGTTASRKHEYLDPDTEPDQFFDYSFYEQGYYDIPATIDYILTDTNQTQLLAVGHSIGTTVFYVMGAERPEYNMKLKVFISLAPICFAQNIRGEAESLTDAWLRSFNAVSLFGFSEILGANQLQTLISNAMCFGPFGYEACQQTLFATFGPDDKGLETEFVPTFFGHYPAGSSTKMFLHASQINVRDKFAKFDYGTLGNLQVYNSPEPQEIDLSKVKMKVALFVGKNDYLSSVNDVLRLRNALPNVVHYQVLPYEKFNHIDFTWGRYMSENLYPYLLPLIQTYSYNDKGNSSSLTT